MGMTPRGGGSGDARFGFADGMLGAGKELSGMSEELRNIIICRIGVMVHDGQFINISSGSQFHSHHIT